MERRQIQQRVNVTSDDVEAVVTSILPVRLGDEAAEWELRADRWNGLLRGVTIRRTMKQGRGAVGRLGKGA